MQLPHKDTYAISPPTIFLFSSPDGNYTKMGFYDFVSDNLTWFNLEKWPGIGQFVCLIHCEIAYIKPFPTWITKLTGEKHSTEKFKCIISVRWLLYPGQDQFIFLILYYYHYNITTMTTSLYPHLIVFAI